MKIPGSNFCLLGDTASAYDREKCKKSRCDNKDKSPSPGENDEIHGKSHEDS